MKKYVLTPVGLEQEAPKNVSESPAAPKQGHFLPTSRKETLRKRIAVIEEQLQYVLVDPTLSSTEKLYRHGALIQAYREAYAELNKPIFAPPFSNEYLGPLPKEGKQQEEEGYKQFLASLLAKAEEEEEEEEKTANASRIMSKFMPPASEKQQSPFSQASFRSSYSQPPFSQPPPKWPSRSIKQEELSDVDDDEQVVTSTPKARQSTPKPIPLKVIRQTSRAETRERRGPKPVDRLHYSRPGVQRIGHGNGQKMRFRFF